MAKGYFKINGNTYYYPQSMQVVYDSLASEDSGRTDDGVMHIQYVKNRLVKLEIKMPPCDSNTCSSLMNSIQGSTGISVSYWDPIEAREVTKTMYCSTASTDWYSGVVTTNGIIRGWQFSLIDTGE